MGLFKPLQLFGRAISGVWRRKAGDRLPPANRAALLLEACLLIRTGAFPEAQAILLHLDKSDSARLNLLGVIWELNHDWPQARKHYGRAIRADRRFAPPQQNLRRWYELVTIGATSLPMLLGDEDPQWWCERSQSGLSEQRRPLAMLLAAKAGSEIYHDN